MNEYHRKRIAADPYMSRHRTWEDRCRNKTQGNIGIAVFMLVVGVLTLVASSQPLLSFLWFGIAWYEWRDKDKPPPNYPRPSRAEQLRRRERIKREHGIN